MKDDELTFGERLILAEEESREVKTVASGGGSPTPETIVVQRQDFTTADSFHFNEPGRYFPLAGPGTLVEAAVIADSDQFDAFVELDGQRAVGDSFTNLQSRSTELTRIDAYQRSVGDYAFSATDYEFQQAVDVVISPQQSITFTLQRAEVDVVRD